LKKDQSTEIDHRNNKVDKN